VKKISAETVRDDFNDPIAVVHYARAAHFLGLWKSESLLIERFFPDRTIRLLEAGCGAGRVAIGLWDLGYRRITAFDFAQELLDQALHLAADRGVDGISWLHADATDLSLTPFFGAIPAKNGDLFDGALFMFNGLMQIPGRANRRRALRELRAVCAPGAPFLFTTHDRDSSAEERAHWRREAARWARGTQNRRLVEFGDRYFTDKEGRTFMHLPDRAEIREDLSATGWTHEFDAMRREIARESRAVQEFSDECRFWVARNSPPIDSRARG
jgi:SAM-dependent methyltransferase